MKEYTEKELNIINNSVIFFVHLRSAKSETHRMQRRVKDATPYFLFEWATEQKEILEKKNKTDYIITNVKLINP